MASAPREVSLFRNGRSQAVRIPKEFELSADKVLMSRDEEGTLHLRPIRPQMTLMEALEWLAAQEPFDEHMPDIDDPAPEPVEMA